MTKSATRRAVLAGWLERSLSQNAPTNLKSLRPLTANVRL